MLLMIQTITHNYRLMKIFRNNAKTTEEVETRILEEQETVYEIFIPWKNSFSGNQFFQWMNDCFKEFEEENIQKDKDIFFFKNESTFAFRISTEILEISPSILWNYWKDQFQGAGYILKNSHSIHKDNVNTLRYYLKPRLRYKVEREQLFGNITLEFIKHNAKPLYIMLKCTWYNDHHFKTAQGYKEIIDLLRH